MGGIFGLAPKSSGASCSSDSTYFYILPVKLRMCAPSVRMSLRISLLSSVGGVNVKLHFFNVGFWKKPETTSLSYAKIQVSKYLCM